MYRLSISPASELFGENLRVFRSQNLTEANFSDTDIQDADFTKAIVTKGRLIKLAPLKGWEESRPSFVIGKQIGIQVTKNKG